MLTFVGKFPWPTAGPVTSQSWSYTVPNTIEPLTWMIFCYENCELLQYLQYVAINFIPTSDFGENFAHLFVQQAFILHLLATFNSKAFVLRSFLQNLLFRIQGTTIFFK